MLYVLQWLRHFTSASPPFFSSIFYNTLTKTVSVELGHFSNNDVIPLYGFGVGLQ